MGLSNEQVEMLNNECETIKGILGAEVFTEILVSYMGLADISEILSGSVDDLFKDDDFVKQGFSMYLAGYVARIHKRDQSKH